MCNCYTLKKGSLIESVLFNSSVEKYKHALSPKF